MSLKAKRMLMLVMKFFWSLLKERTMAIFKYLERHFFSIVLLLKTMQVVILKRKMLLKCIYDFHFSKNFIIISLIQALIQYLIIYSTRYCIRCKEYRNQQNSQSTNKYAITNFGQGIQSKGYYHNWFLPMTLGFLLGVR